MIKEKLVAQPETIFQEQLITGKLNEIEVFMNIMRHCLEISF